MIAQRTLDQTADLSRRQREGCGFDLRQKLSTLEPAEVAPTCCAGTIRQRAHHLFKGLTGFDALARLVHPGPSLVGRPLDLAALGAVPLHQEVGDPDFVQDNTLDHVQAKGGLHLAPLSRLKPEHGLFEGRVHHAWAKGAQVPSSAGAGSIRVRSRECREVLARVQAGRDLHQPLLGSAAGAANSRRGCRRTLEAHQDVARGNPSRCTVGKGGVPKVGGIGVWIAVKNRRLGSGKRRGRHGLCVVFCLWVRWRGLCWGRRHRRNGTGRLWGSLSACQAPGQGQHNGCSARSQGRCGHGERRIALATHAIGLPMLWLALLLSSLASASPTVTTDAASPAQIESWLDRVVVLITGPAWCSGVVIDEDHILTAYHCVANGRRSLVRSRAGAEWTGRTVAADPSEDLALVRVEGLSGALEPLALVDEPLQRGQRVYGLGHPFGPAAEQAEPLEGLLLWSVTEGIVSGVGPRLVQTDAALNPGNSGGPVVDNAGRIVGITSRKLGGDNVAFLASPAVVEAFLANQPRVSLLGGTLGVGLSYLGGSVLLDERQELVAQSLLLTGDLVVRERLVAHLGVGLSTGARLLSLERGAAAFPSAEAALLLRQRIGRGTFSTTVDIGGGVAALGGYTTRFDTETGTFATLPTAGIVGPTATARLGLAGIGLRAVALLDDPTRPLVLVGLDLDVPGVIKTF